MPSYLPARDRDLNRLPPVSGISEKEKETESVTVTERRKKRKGAGYKRRHLPPPPHRRHISPPPTSLELRAPVCRSAIGYDSVAQCFKGRIKSMKLKWIGLCAGIVMAFVGVLGIGSAEATDRYSTHWNRGHSKHQYWQQVQRHREWERRNYQQRYENRRIYYFNRPNAYYGYNHHQPYYQQYNSARNWHSRKGCR